MLAFFVWDMAEIYLNDNFNTAPAPSSRLLLQRDRALLPINAHCLYHMTWVCIRSRLILQTRGDV